MTRLNIAGLIARSIFYVGTLVLLWLYLHMPLVTGALTVLYLMVEAGIQAGRLQDKRVPLFKLADY